MEQTLYELFDYYCFQGNADLEAVLKEVEVRLDLQSGRRAANNPKENSEELRPGVSRPNS